MLKKWKRIIAAVLSSAMILTCSGCTVGKNTAYALTVDGYQVRAGVYIYYSFSALSDAKSKAKAQDENIDTEDNDALQKVKIDGKNFLDYVKDKTTESCINHVTVIKHFDELSLSLTEEQEDEISSYVDSAWESNESMFKENGISKESLTEVMTSSYKSDEIFKAFYGENGSENVTDSQLKDYYVENNARVRYISMDLHDSEGNELDAAGKKEIKDMADDFLKRAKAAENEEKMLEEFNVFQEEYDKYVSDKAAEAVGDDEDGTAETTTTAATTTATTTTTTAANNAELEKLSSEAERLKEEAENAEADEEAQAAYEKAQADYEEAMQKAAEEEEKAAEEAENSAESETTTAPESDESESTETTTTTSIHANERVIHVVTTNEDTKEEDISYTPSKKSYDWIFKDAKAGVPEIIEDEETMYVIVKFDIKDRMTDDDLWSESNIESVRYEMFSDDLQDMLEEWGKEYEVVKNEKAYKKYNALDIKFQ